MAVFEGQEISLYYERAGEGAPLLFISGTGGDLRAKPNVFDSDLPKNFDLLAFDQRGLGQSAVPEGPYSMADYADDAARLLDHIGWQDCLVIGVSFGGMVAQEFVLRHPGRAKRLVLACTSSGGKGGASYPLHELDGMEPRERTRHMLSISDARLSPEWQAANEEKVEEIIDMTLAMRADLPVTEDSLRGAALQLGARRYHDTFDRLGEIDVPTFVCGGAHDNLASPENLKNLSAAIPGSSLKFYEGGHMFLIQDRNAYKDIIAFLKGDNIA